MEKGKLQVTYSSDSTCQVNIRNSLNRAD